MWQLNLSGFKEPSVGTKAEIQNVFLKKEKKDGDPFHVFLSTR